MRKAQKQQIIDIIKTLYEAHDIIKKHIKHNKIELVFNLLAECQNTAVLLGENIEKSEGENLITVTYLENYCDELYKASLALEKQNINPNNLVKHLNKSLIDVENSIKSDIKVKYEIVFMPYKASMWDSLESIWKAADADENCDAYVVPIPYYDRNTDLSLGEYHYEGLQFPDYVPIVSSYNLEKRRPDVIYIHNPYDSGNLVTSVDPKYYSDELKKYTDCLVYVPYYSTSGGMSEGQKSCPAYYNANYIVTQSDYFYKFFDSKLPLNKFLPLGSPKFDRVINICNNPSAPPIDWQLKMQGKKVYFYNTSITGMLENTEQFLKKMQYVFKCFVGRQDACLLWRPHPLLESTFESMRPQYLNMYRRLKQFFIDKNLGIYDDTSDMDKTIAISDAYIGDAGTSVISIFGITGKPIFILYNNIDASPTDNDIVASILLGFNYIAQDKKSLVCQGNKFYYSENGNFKYKYICTVSKNLYEYSYGLNVEDKIYLLPVSTQELAIIENGILTKVKFRQTDIKQNSFCAMLQIDKYIVFIPNNYDAIVRYDTQTGEISYFSEDLHVFIRIVNGERKVGGFCSKGDLLYIASPIDDMLYVLNIKTGKHEILSLNNDNWLGTLIMYNYKDEIWFVPYQGTTVMSYIDGKIKEYNCNIDGNICADKPFSFPAFSDDFVYLPAYCADKCVKINKISGEVSEYIPPFEMPDKPLNCYYFSPLKSTFLNEIQDGIYLMFSYYDRALYEVNLKHNTAKKINITLDINELKLSEKGFDVQIGNVQYGCMENAFNSLEDFLNNNITGSPYDKNKQIAAYSKIANNIDGSCGKKIHKAIMDKISK